MGLFFKSKLEKALEETQRHQAAAADPAASAWVSANAGTGKTHVLTMRVLRLLLAGTAPERILALTYTKAAAAEMSKRVFARLAEWVTDAEPALKKKLAVLLGRAPTAADMQRARQLFAIAIETPGGLKVQTIHAFCERLLQRFPLEAGVPPNFAILDYHEQRTLLKEAADDMLAEATATPGTPLASALTSAVAFATDDNFDALLMETMRERDWLASAVRLGRDAETIYRRALGIGPGTDGRKVAEQLAALLPESELAALHDILDAGSKTDRDLAASAASAQKANGQDRRIDALADLFLTGKGEPRKSLMTKPLATRHPEVLARLERVQHQFVALHAERCKLVLLDAALALIRLGSAVLQRYGDAKARRAALDFDDLVARAANLLGSSASVEWVLYKLDGGLDHILVDEAQDTSSVQWQVIRSLADEFFAGAGASEVVRTLFAVGDEKQSIYGFQGAAPAMFGDVGEALAARAGRAGMAWQRVPLNLSFRTVEPLLSAIDGIFADSRRTPGVTAAGKPLEHFAHRAGQAGLIEIWPTEKKEQVVPAEPWSPLEEATASSPVVRLAARIADTIAGWLASSARLESEDRPITPGDILVLVRKRTPFAPAMISALKLRGIPVAGADRLVLTEQIAVQDLTALGDFLVLPDDDLALAAVLKSPLFGLDDDDLLALAPERRGSLWQELLARADAAPRLQAAAETLKRWRAQADRAPPFEFYAALLDGDGMRARMLDRLGVEAADAIDEFLNLALGYDDTAPPSLQGFLSWLREGVREIKRDMEQGRGEVRVMTVHGAKGLEAPIVFLPDTCSTRSGRRPGSLLKLESAARPVGTPAPLLWPVKGTSNLDPVQQAKTAILTAETQERNRLLYVALTRARDRLYVAGFENGAAPPADCWYNLIKDGLGSDLEEVATADGRTIWRRQSAQTAKHEAPKIATHAAAAAAPLPDWASRPAPKEPLITIPLTPSRLAPLETDVDGEPMEPPRGRLAEPPILPPAALADDYRFLRGTLTHALLEHLPALPRARREAAAEAFIAARGGTRLPDGVRKGIVAETLAILHEPAFAALFGPDARAEVAIAAEIPHPQGRGPALRLAGKIDRLVREGRSVLIVDYKTNRPPPHDVAHVADAYLLQLAAYRIAAQSIFKGLHIRAALLWTDGPRIMEIPGELLDVHQQRLWQLDPASLDA